MGLQSAYNESVEVREFCGKLDSLAFLPISDVKEGINVLYGEIPEQPEYPELKNFDALLSTSIVSM